MKKTKPRKPPTQKKNPAKNKKAPTKKDPTLQLAQAIAENALESKGLDTHILDIRKLSSFADYLVVSSGDNVRQVASMADRIEEALAKKFGKKPRGVEGLQAAHWVLMDYGDVVCHIFLEEYRHLYRLEDLWHNAKRVKLKNLA